MLGVSLAINVVDQICFKQHLDANLRNRTKNEKSSWAISTKLQYIAENLLDAKSFYISGLIPS